MKKQDISIFAISDIHFGAGDSKSLYNQLTIFKDNIKEKKPDLIVICGDLFHTKLQLNSKHSYYAILFINDIIKLCEEYDIQLRIISGTASHDYDQLKIFNGVDESILKIYYNKTVETFKGNKILYIPEEYLPNYKEYYKDVFNDKYEYIFGHGTIEFQAHTAQISECERHIKSAPIFTMDELINCCNKYIVFGHIHQHCNYKHQIYYIGSYTINNHGETGIKGFLYINNNSIELIENTLTPNFITVKMSELLSRFDNNMVEVLEEIKKLSKTAKVRIDGDINLNHDQLSVLRTTTNGKDNISIKLPNKRLEEHKKDDRFNFLMDKTLTIPEIINKYININKGIDIDVNTIESMLKDDE